MNNYLFGTQKYAGKRISGRTHRVQFGACECKQILDSLHVLFFVLKNLGLVAAGDAFPERIALVQRFQVGALVIRQPQEHRQQADRCWVLLEACKHPDQLLHGALPGDKLFAEHKDTCASDSSSAPKQPQHSA
jgi:hypothetical protein